MSAAPRFNWSANVPRRKLSALTLLNRRWFQIDPYIFLTFKIDQGGVAFEAIFTHFQKVRSVMEVTPEGAAAEAGIIGAFDFAETHSVY